MKMLVATAASKSGAHTAKYAVMQLRVLSSSSNAIVLLSVHDAGLRHAKALVK